MVVDEHHIQAWPPRAQQQLLRQRGFLVDHHRNHRFVFIFKKIITVPQGAAPGRPDPGAAGCTGRIVGANNGGAMAKNNGSQNNSSTRVNPQLEAVRTYGPGR